MTSHPADDPISNPDAEYSEIPADRALPPDVIFPSAEEAKARRKRTRTYVLLGILVMSLVAMLVALLLHFHLQKCECTKHHFLEKCQFNVFIIPKTLTPEEQDVNVTGVVVHAV